jgi:predicted ferric reductase
MVKLAALRGPLVMAVICGIPIVLWLRAAPVEPRFSTSTLALTSAGVLCAFAGTAAFAINLVLGARLRIVEWLFGGLDRMYRVHRQNGQIAFALLAMHAFLIFAGRVTVSVSSGFDLVTPRAGRVIFAGFVAITLMGIALVLTLFVRLGQEVFVYVQRTFGFVFLLATYHVFATHGAKDLSAALEWTMVVIATAGIAAFVYRSLLHNVLVRRTRYTVVDPRRLAEVLVEIRARGWASTDEELEEGISSVAAPVLVRDDAGVRAVAAVSVVGPSARLRRSGGIATIAGHAVRAAGEIGERLSRTASGA